jgi:catechol 2,3-dioxygenase-like lactoylglutathione lyase family enzyme
MANGIAKLWKPVVNVCDLNEGERFWSALTGLSPTGRHGDDHGDSYSVLDDLDGGEDAPWLLLQLVPGDQTSWIGGTHLDLRVDDVALAVRRTEAIGGLTVKPPALYPSDDAAYLEWAIMQDPFGNQFCFVKWPLESLDRDEGQL